jgi:succinate dehydrogenase hydrophobic anchor subunit
MGEFSGLVIKTKKIGLLNHVYVLVFHGWAGAWGIAEDDRGSGK